MSAFNTFKSFVAASAQLRYRRGKGGKLNVGKQPFLVLIRHKPRRTVLSLSVWYRYLDFIRHLKGFSLIRSL